jgi:hypothetical protein
MTTLENPKKTQPQREDNPPRLPFVAQLLQDVPEIRNAFAGPTAMITGMPPNLDTSSD